MPHKLVRYSGPLIAILLFAAALWALHRELAGHNLGDIGVLADGVGFEPTRGANPCRFSRPVPSTARPPIRARNIKYLGSTSKGTTLEHWHPIGTRGLSWRPEPLQGRVDGVCRLCVGLVEQVRVDPQRDVRLGVPEALAYCHDVDSGIDQLAHVRVP
jgi:hypothetical protein